MAIDYNMLCRGGGGGMHKPINYNMLFRERGVCIRLKTTICYGGGGGGMHKPIDYNMFCRGGGGGICLCLCNILYGEESMPRPAIYAICYVVCVSGGGGIQGMGRGYMNRLTVVGPIQYVVWGICLVYTIRPKPIQYWYVMWGYA